MVYLLVTCNTFKSYKSMKQNSPETAKTKYGVSGTCTK